MEKYAKMLTGIINEQDFCFEPDEVRTVEKALGVLKKYEDTGYTPEEIAKLQATLIVCDAEFRKTREKLKEFYDRDINLERALNSGLRAENAKLAADRKALINELCHYCGKYKQAHDGACDGCKWRGM